METTPMNEDRLTQAAESLERQLEADAPNIPADMRRKLANIGALARAQATDRPPSQPEPQKETAQILQYPLPFGEDTRAVSNPMARCALFAPVKERQFFKDYVTVGEVDGVKIEFKGEQLNQDDHDSLLQLVKIANYHHLGEDLRHAVNPILRELGRGTHKSQREQFFAEIDRLVSGTLRLTPKGKPSYICHLIDDASTPQDQAVLPEYRRHLVYRLNPRLPMFYNSAIYTLFDWRDRLKLKGRGSEFAKWLHLWIIGNAEQFAHKVETIREKCGSTTKDLKKFRQLLRQALDLLKKAGIITSWRIDEADRVHIERTPSPAQLGHLAKKARKPRAKHQPGGLKKAQDYI